MWLFFFNDTATTEIYTLSLHDALPIYSLGGRALRGQRRGRAVPGQQARPGHHRTVGGSCRQKRSIAHGTHRSEEHTSELQSRQYLVCRLLLEKKKKDHSQCNNAHTTLA